MYATHTITCSTLGWALQPNSPFRKAAKCPWPTTGLAVRSHSGHRTESNTPAAWSSNTPLPKRPAETRMISPPVPWKKSRRVIRRPPRWLALGGRRGPDRAPLPPHPEDHPGKDGNRHESDDAFGELLGSSLQLP